eukprot:2783409-Rhodomonas_salina.3
MVVPGADSTALRSPRQAGRRGVNSAIILRASYAMPAFTLRFIPIPAIILRVSPLSSHAPDTPYLLSVYACATRSLALALTWTEARPGPRQLERCGRCWS